MLVDQHQPKEVPHAERIQVDIENRFDEPLSEYKLQTADFQDTQIEQSDYSAWKHEEYPIKQTKHKIVSQMR